MSAAARFWSKVDKTPGHGPDGDCWLFTGSLMAKGYGRIGWGDKCLNTSAAHVSLELDGRPRPSPKAEALHSCDNPPCVNPAHLHWGTHRENMAQRAARGRSILCGKPGEANNLAKLTEEAVRYIRSSNEQLKPLADRFGVSISAVSQARLGTTWKGVK